MSEKTFSELRLEDDDFESAPTAKRRHERRKQDQCVIVIKEQTYPVENWSQSGVMIFSNPQLFGIAEEHDITMKFKLSEGIVDLPHKARVVRKSFDRVALEFAPLTRKTQKGFHAVIEDFITAQFADSQKI